MRTGGVRGELAGKRLLIVDDNATNRRILAAQAASWSMETRETGSPREALGWIAAGEAFDLAILDRQMPEMDGVALAAAIREHRDTKVLPLVLFSSLGRHETDDISAFAAVLTKPVKQSQLFDLLVGLFAAEATGILRQAQDERGQLATERGSVGARHASPSARAAGQTSAPHRPLRLLVAEDNVTNQRLTTLLLERLGYRADVVANGLEALDALARHPYDVVLMDVQMPEMDGLDATRAIRAHPPRGGGGPRIIAMTANAMQGDREACLAAGMNDYVSKPVRVEELAAALERAAEAVALPAGPSPTPDTRYPTPSVALDAGALEALGAMLAGSEPGTAGAVFDAFFEDGPRLVGQMRAGIAAADARTVQRAAHTLKSDAAQFGATALSADCRELEDLTRTGSLAGAEALVGRIDAAWSAALPAIQAARQRFEPEQNGEA